MRQTNIFVTFKPADPGLGVVNPLKVANSPLSLTTPPVSWSSLYDRSNKRKGLEITALDAPAAWAP